MASILIVSGSSEGDYYLLGRQTVVVGRDDGCHIQIVDNAVSRKHLQIRPGG
ncbi:MAG: FHA domain-containing protein, partial [Planctomycetota bacterium]